MKLTTLLLTVALSAQNVVSAPADVAEKRQSSAALMRFECSQLVIERLDPLVQPGLTPSSHVHQVAGGNSFNASMDPASYDPSALSTCTTCTYADDFSNYWTASLYFRARNGTFKRVPQLTNLGLKGKNGGLTVYYNSPYDGKTKVTAFKPVSVPLLFSDQMLMST
jgi:hypothetical protein